MTGGLFARVSGLLDIPEEPVSFPFATVVENEIGAERRIRLRRPAMRRQRPHQLVLLA